MQTGGEIDHLLSDDGFIVCCFDFEATVIGPQID